MGLRNTDQRLEALYGKHYLFELDIQASGGLKTIIHLPYEFDRDYTKPAGQQAVASQ